MTERAHPANLRHWASRWPVTVIAAGAAALLLLAAVFGAPYAFDGNLLDTEIAAQIRVATGLSVTTKVRLRFDLLPRPHVVAKGLHVTDPTATLAIEAAEFRGDVRLLPLLVGRVELTGATLVRPHLTIDLDGRPIAPDSTIGRALRAQVPVDANAPLGTVTLLDGTAVLKSQRFPRLPAFSNVNVSIDWPDLGSPASVTGTVEFQRIAADVAAWVAQPSTLMRGDLSAVTLSLHSAPLDVSATGDLSSSTTTNFRGHLAVSTPSGADLLALGGGKLHAPARLANLTLTSDATLAVDDDGAGSLDLPNLHMRVDDNDFEGTLAVQSGGKPLVSGTLACDQLSLAPFLKTMPSLLDAHARWTTTKIDASASQPLDLDLRISASHLRLTPFTIDDAALSVLTRDERTEIGLIDGKAYGGTVKGRLSFAADGGRLSLRGAGSLDDVDAAPLSWDTFGRQMATGQFSGSVNVEASGDSPAALVSSLAGWARAETRGGELSTVDLGRPVQAGPGAASDALVGRTPFDSLLLDLRLADGVAAIEKGSLTGSETNLALRGRVDMRDRQVQVTAATTAPQAAPVQTFVISGTFPHLVVAPTASPKTQAFP